MPSAATAKLEKQASTEAVDPIRQAIVIIEHKIRNLEKRKRKIESYREEQKNGKDLNSDQLTAIAKYEEVQQTLEFARDLCKQFNGIMVDAAKLQKKLARKDALDRAQKELAKVKEVLIIQDVLQNMGQDNVREDFLAGRNGAALLCEEDLKYLDDLYGEVSPKHGGEEGSPSFQEQIQHSAEHLANIIDGKSKEIVGTTYAKLKEIIATIHASGYFDQVQEEVVEEQTEELQATAEGEIVSTQEVIAEEEYVAETSAIPSTETFPQDVTPVSQPTSNLSIPSTMVAQSPAAVPTPVAPVPTPVAAVESSYFSTAAPTFVPAQTPALQQPRPLNEVISSVNSSFNFLQESELDSPDLSSMITGTSQQNQHSTPPPSGPVAPIPSQTFTNQNFVSVPTSNVPQQVVYQPPNELAQSHIPGFATATPNPPPPIPMPPSHTHSVSPPAIQQTYSNQTATQQQATYATQTQQPQQGAVMQNPYTAQLQQQQQQQQPQQQQQQQQQPQQEQANHQQVTEQISSVNLEDATDDWSQNDNQTDWSQQTESQGDWSQQTEGTVDWASTTDNQNDPFITQPSTRVYGSGNGRGRMNRGNGRGSSNNYSGNRNRGNYQNGRGGGGGGYGYRNNESGNNGYYQNGYQRDNFNNSNYGGGYKRGPRGGGTGGSMRGGDRGGPRGGSGNRGGNNPRGNRGGSGGFARGGNNKQ